MKRMFLAAGMILAASLFTTARADEPKFFLNPDGSVEQRLAGVESKTAALEKRIADLEKKLAVKATAAAPSKIRFSVCINGKCTTHECDDLSQVPTGATILSGVAGVSAAGPCPTGPCGDNCSCAAAVAVSSSSVAGPSRRSGRPGLLGRLRGGGGCSTCGQ